MQQKHLLAQQESEIASLNDRVALMRERIRESRDHLTRYRQPGGILDRTPRSEQSTPFRTPQRHHAVNPNSQEKQGFAALLHATDLVSQGGVSASPTPKHRKGQGHSRPSHSLSSMPVTPQRGYTTKASRTVYYTPENPRQGHYNAPQTAPLARTLDFSAAIARSHEDHVHESDGTLSALDDSEAETEVPDKEFDIDESQASTMASQMLRSPTSKRDRDGAPKGMVQGRLFGQIRKTGIERVDDSPGAKKAKTADKVGLGIANVKD